MRQRHDTQSHVLLRLIDNPFQIIQAFSETHQANVNLERFVDVEHRLE